MRTNIDIDDAVMDAAMKAGIYQTKKDAVEAGLKLIARQAAYREILRWEGKLNWDADVDADAEQAVKPPQSAPPLPDRLYAGGVASPGLRLNQDGPALVDEVREPANKSRRRRAGR